MSIQWIRESEKWLRSQCGRYKISRNDIYCDVRYTCYEWISQADLLPIVIGTVESPKLATELCRLNFLYGGSP